MQKNKPPLKKRLGALWFDYLVILGWMAVIAAGSAITYLLLGEMPDYLGALGPLGAQALFFTVLTLPVGLYLFMTESSPRHATLGKRKVGISVASTTGRALTQKQICVRTFIKLLPWEIAHTFMWQMQYVFYQKGYDAMPEPWIFIGLNIATFLAIIYLAMVIFRRDGRGPHDIIARTQVMRKT